MGSGLSAGAAGSGGCAAGRAGTPQDAKHPRQCGSRGKSADSAAERRMSAVLPDWSEMNRVGDEVSRSDGLVTDTAMEHPSEAS